MDASAKVAYRPVADYEVVPWPGRESDEGIWEERSGLQHHTTRRCCAGVAFDRLVATHEAGHIRVSADQFRATADEIRAEIEAHGYNVELQSYTRVFGGQARITANPGRVS